MPNARTVTRFKEIRLVNRTFERGNRTIKGVGMLLHQGRPAWKLWFDIEPVVTPKLRERMERSIAGGTR